MASFLLQSLSELAVWRFILDENKHQSGELTQTHNEVFGTVEGKQKGFSAEEALSSFPRSTDI